MRRRALWTAGAVLAAVAIVVALLAGPLTQPDYRLRASNLYPDTGLFVNLEPGQEACQDQETIPAGATNLQFKVRMGSVFKNAGPVEVAVYADGEVVRRAQVTEPFRDGPLTAGFAPPARDIPDATICLTNQGTSPFALGGMPARSPANRDLRFRYAERGAIVDGVAAVGRARIEFYFDGTPRPLDQIGTVADRVGMFKSGAVEDWAFWGMLGFLALGVLALVGGTAAGARAPIAIGAVLVASSWALLTPPFQVPDELPHYGHAGYVAETAEQPPTGPFQWHSNREMEQIEYGMPWGFTTEPFWFESQDERVREALAGDLDRLETYQAGFTANVPLLYYLYEAVPYQAAYDGTLLDRLLLMRLATALLSGVLALLVFGFLREVLPGSPLAAGAGAAAVAVHPVVGHLAGGVSPDVLLWVWSAAIFWGIARAFRRGLTWRLGALIGLAAFAGAITKPAMATLAPGVAFALLVLIVRAGPRRREALAGTAALGAAALVPYLGYQLLSPVLFGSSPVVGAGFASTDVGGQGLQLREFLSYAWQFHLPKLSFMTDQFSGPFPLEQIYFKGWIGRFGWHQYDFGDRTEQVGLIVCLALIGLAIAALVRFRERLRGRRAEALTYLAMLAGVMLMVSAAGYRYVNHVALSFEQVRYLFPALLPLYGLAVALAVQAFGRSRALPVAAFVLTLLAGHALGAQLLTIERFYL